MLTRAARKRGCTSEDPPAKKSKPNTQKLVIEFKKPLTNTESSQETQRPNSKCIENFKKLKNELKENSEIKSPFKHTTSKKLELKSDKEAKWKWLGKPEIKINRGNKQLVFYEKALDSVSGIEIEVGSIVKLKQLAVKGHYLAQITFLYEEETKKKAEVRLFYHKKEEYIETLEYYIISLKKVIEVIDSEEFCASKLKTKNNSLQQVEDDENSRLERSLNHSRLYLELFHHRNPLLRAIALLTLSSVPSKLVGREQETSQILEFLEAGIKSRGSKSSLYMCGMPGTGKTATFLYAVSTLQNSDKSFLFVHVNCMKLAKPNEIYTVIHQEIFDSKKHPNASFKALDNYVKSSKKKTPVVILLDELDALINRKQDVVYNIFNWSTLKGSSFIITGIANTMNLSERFISKVSSRMGRKQLVFSPYSRRELENIITKRLEDTLVFEEEAIIFCSAKVASYSGDARRAFQVCKRAAFLAFEAKDKTVNMGHVQKGFSQLFASSYVLAIPKLPFYLKVFLICLCMDLKNNMSESCSLARVRTRINDSSLLQGKEGLSILEAEEIANRLSSLRICSRDKQNVRLVISPDEVLQGLKSDFQFSDAVRILSGS